MSTHFDSLISGLEQERKQLVLQLGKLDQVLATLRQLTGSGKVAKRRTISAAGRRRIAAAQRKRWARVRGGK